MKTVLVLAAFVALALAGSDTTEIEVKTVDETTVSRQYKVLELFEAIYQVNKHASYYEVGLNYNIAAHKDDYKDQEAVENFLKLWRRGFVPKAHVFSIFDYKMRQETIALFELFYTAKNFDVFYATAAWARVHVNEAMFAYTFYIAMTQRLDTNDLVVPPYYEIMPDLFLNSNVVNKMQYTKMRGLPYQEFPFYGIFIHDKENYYYANYSDYYTYSHDEYKISYLTEDIGWNTYYTYFHANMPFYLKGDEIYGGVPKERLGEIYYYIYQQILSRYYLERLTNSIGEIPVFSWNKPFEYGYHPLMTTKFYPFAQRPNKYFMQTDKNLDDLRFIRNYEDLFLDFLEKGQFKEYNKEVNFWDPEAINFVADFWQTNPDLYEKTQKTEYHRSYEMAARRVLGGSSLTYEFKDYKFFPTALDFHQTSLRDPAFYQIYNKILNFIVQYKKFVKPYTKEELSFPGVKINKFEVDKLETFFDFRKFNASNSLYYTEEELIKENDSYMVVQPRLNHKPFNVKVYLKSEVEEEAAFKIFMGPKYDSRGNEIKIEDNWMNFITMDWWTQKLVKGDNVIERKSNDFFYSKKDSLSIGELYKLLEVNQLPKNMLEKRSFMPESLMLPRGQKGGFPVQFFVMVYKNTPLPKEWEAMKDYILDLKPFGFPLDRPMDYYLMQPNMFIEEVKIYHDGSEEPWNLKMEEAVPHSNKVTKH